MRRQIVCGNYEYININALQQKIKNSQNLLSIHRIMFSLWLSTQWVLYLITWFLVWYGDQSQMSQSLFSLPCMLSLCLVEQKKQVTVSVSTITTTAITSSYQTASSSTVAVITSRPVVTDSQASAADLVLSEAVISRKSAEVNIDKPLLKDLAARAQISGKAVCATNAEPPSSPAPAPTVEPYYWHWSPQGTSRMSHLPRVPIWSAFCCH